MRAVVQRVSEASVTVEGETVSQIGMGLLILVGVEMEDTEAQAEKLAAKICKLRIFRDDEEKMNLSVKDIGGGIIAVSQFTLCADTRKGNRPSFIYAAPPEKANPLYELFCKAIETQGINCGRGVFGAHMDVRLCNHGPVTILLDV